MMKLAIILLVVVVVYSFPQGDVEILRSENDNDGMGNFQWAYETSDGTKADQQGELRSGTLEDGNQGQFQTMKGSYEYMTDKGRKVTVTYEADEKGYRAKTSVA